MHIKRNIMLCALCVLFAGGVFAQQIKAGPLEGRWTFNQKWDDDPEFMELVFLGNVMLGADEDYLEYEGYVCTFTERTIKSVDGDFIWQYRLSGNDLTIITEDDERFSYTWTKPPARSPLEGIWEFTEGPTDDVYMTQNFLFTGNIMAISEDDEYNGFKVSYQRKYILLYPELFGLDDYGDITEKILADYGIEYHVSGITLTIIIDGLPCLFKKVY